MENSTDDKSTKQQENSQASTKIQTPTPQQPTETTPEQPLEPTPLHKTKKWLPPVLIGIMVLALGIAGLFFYQNFQLKKKQPSSALPIPTPVSDLPTPTTNPTADWETYSNQNLGVTFKYPKSLESYSLSTASESISGNLEIILRGRRDDYIETLMRVGVIEEKTSRKLTLEEFVEENTDGGESISEVSIAGRRGIKLLFIKGPYTIFSEEILAGAQELIITKHSNGYLYIKTRLIKEVRPEYPEYLDQILSTFKFVYSGSTDTKNWETYSSESIGISLEHPQNDIIQEPQLDASLTIRYSGNKVVNHELQDGYILSILYHKIDANTSSLNERINIVKDSASDLCTVTDTSTLQIDGQVTYVFMSTDCTYDTTRYFVRSNTHQYQISATHNGNTTKYQEITNKIIDSIKFL